MAVVPVTPAVVSWAVNESGFTLEEIADATGASPTVIRAWIAGTAQPTVTQARRLAKKLKRPLAFLLWSSPPTEPAPTIAFRAPTAGDMRELNPTERRYIRQAFRLQRTAAWLRRELGILPATQLATRLDDPGIASFVARQMFGVSVEEQLGWSSEHVALREWRARFEQVGILVFFFALGGESCRGATLADELAPVVIVNTHFNAQARIFTLFHELGHVVTGTTSACSVGGAPRNDRVESIERWCEEFAAASLMPRTDVEQHLATRAGGESADLQVAGSLARAFKVSLRAAVLRLISLDRATWGLWNAIPEQADFKSGGGGSPEEPRTLPVVRLHEFGHATASLFVEAMRADLIDRSQAASYLRVHDGALSEIEGRVERSRG